MRDSWVRFRVTKFRFVSIICNKLWLKSGLKVLKVEMKIWLLLTFLCVSINCFEWWWGRHVGHCTSCILNSTKIFWQVSFSCPDWTCLPQTSKLPALGICCLWSEGIVELILHLAKLEVNARTLLDSVTTFFNSKLLPFFNCSVMCLCDCV